MRLSLVNNDRSMVKLQIITLNYLPPHFTPPGPGRTLSTPLTTLV